MPKYNAEYGSGCTCVEYFLHIKYHGTAELFGSEVFFVLVPIVASNVKEFLQSVSFGEVLFPHKTDLLLLYISVFPLFDQIYVNDLSFTWPSFSRVRLLDPL